ncbi:MAG: hypothetical protein EOO61_07450 [Hymenobacter sp.]|nr:MAG: hypothetical protein EOO61_07450 [Hymenobacter sp.]
MNKTTITIVATNNQPDLAGPWIWVQETGTELQTYLRGELRPYYDNNLKYVTLRNAENKNMTARLLFSDFINGNTGQAFASGQELQQYISANFLKANTTPGGGVDLTELKNKLNQMQASIVAEGVGFTPTNF